MAFYAADDDRAVVLHLKDSASVTTFLSTLRGAGSLAQRASQAAGHLHLPEMTSWCARARAIRPARVRASRPRATLTLTRFPRPLAGR
jgi:hypothetical protein